jgi:hypothetical protein
MKCATLASNHVRTAIVSKDRPRKIPNSSSTVLVEEVRYWWRTDSAPLPNCVPATNVVVLAQRSLDWNDLAVLREGRLVPATEWPRPGSTHWKACAVGPDRQLRVPVSHDSTRCSTIQLRRSSGWDKRHLGS